MHAQERHCRDANQGLQRLVQSDGADMPPINAEAISKITSGLLLNSCRFLPRQSGDVVAVPRPNNWRQDYAKTEHASP